MKKLFILLFTLISFNVSATTDSTVVDTSKVAVTIDELITKYGPTIQEKAGTFWQFLMSTGEASLEIVYKYLLFNNIFWLFITIIGLIITYFLSKYFWKLQKEDEYGDWAIGAILTNIFGYLIFGIAFLVNLYDLFKLIIVPELAIIEYIMCLIK